MLHLINKAEINAHKKLMWLKLMRLQRVNFMEC